MRSVLRESGGRFSPVDDRRARSTTLNVLAVLFAGRGLMNVFKRFGTGSGLVFFGHLLPPATPAGCRPW